MRAAARHPSTIWIQRFVSETQNAIRNAHDLVSLQFALDLPSSLWDLIYHFNGHDVVNTQYDFTSWQRANKMAHAIC